MKFQESQLQLNKSQEIIGEKLDQLHWSDVWKDGQEEFTHSDFSLMVFQPGSNSKGLANLNQIMMKLTVNQQHQT